MGKPEGKVEEYLKKRVHETRGELRKVRWLCRNGGPDRLVWWGFPRAAFVEVKAPGEDVDWRTPQGREIRRLRQDGWLVFVVSSKEQVDEMVELVRAGGSVT